MEKEMKEYIMRRYGEEEFELERLMIEMTHIKRMRMRKKIYEGFKGLEEALEGCISSSHIPLLTGPIIKKYKNEISLDGCFSKEEEEKEKEIILEIRPNMWKEEKKSKKEKIKENPLNIENYTTLLSKNKYNFEEEYKKGYEDAMKNKNKLDEILKKKNINTNNNNTTPTPITTPTPDDEI